MVQKIFAPSPALKAYSTFHSSKSASPQLKTCLWGFATENPAPHKHFTIDI